MAKKKFNPFVLLYVISGILLIISIAPIADTARDIYSTKGRYSAIEYHRSLRSKKQVSSVLDEIEGIGPARRKALMKHFLDIDKIRNANVSELMEAEGITENVAQNIYKYFH